MGLKPRLLSPLLESGMEHGSLLHDSLMVLKGDHPTQPNGSPLLLSPSSLKGESFANNTASKPIGSNGCSMQRTLPSLPPLKVDVNGFKQSPLVSPMEPSSLTSSALPTPLLDLESNSNCSDSAVPHGDLYPSNFVATGVSFRTHAVGADLRSPGTSGFVQQQPQYQPQTGFFPHVPKPPPPVKNPPINLKRANENALRKAFNEKVSRRKEELKFMIPKSAEANSNQLSTMLKKARRQTNLPKAIDTALFEEGGLEPAPKPNTEKPKKTMTVVDEYATDYSDCEETPDLISVPYNKIRECEERVRFAADDARIVLAIEEKKRRLAQLEQALNFTSSESPTLSLSTSPSAEVCARMRPYTRENNRKLHSLRQSVDYSKMQPSTSSCAALRPTSQIAVPSMEEDMAAALHWISMVPSFTLRRSVNQPVHLIDSKDLSEETLRNGTSRRAERERKKMRPEAKPAPVVHRAVDSYDSYEDTEPEDDEYVPHYESPGKKTKSTRGTGRGRGRPTREQQKERDNQQTSKLNRRYSTANTKQPNAYEYDPYSSEIGISSLPASVQYSEIEVPAFSLVKDESILVETDSCTHAFEDLITDQIHHHRIMEVEERTRFKMQFKQVGRKKAAVVERQPSVDEELEEPSWPAPSPAPPIHV